MVFVNIVSNLFCVSHIFISKWEKQDSIHLVSRKETQGFPCSLQSHLSCPQTLSKHKQNICPRLLLLL